MLVFGENSLDFVARTAGTPPVAGKHTLQSFETLTGGQGATAALGCARQGLRVCYAGAFGRDSGGDAIRKALTAANVRVLALEPDGAMTRTAVVIVDPLGERTVYEFRDPKLDVADPLLTVSSTLPESRVLLVDATDIASSIALAKAARRSGARVMVDVDCVTPRTAELLGEIDVIIVPVGFAHVFTGEPELRGALRAIARRFPAAVVTATCGGNGSLTLSDGHEWFTPAFHVDVVDTTGAGDAFRAGFCSAWCRLGEDASLERVLLFANATAALTCGALGAQAGLPTWDEVASLVTMAR